jgi:hypothetical protein
LKENVEAAKAIPPSLGVVVIATAIAQYFKWPLQTLAGKSSNQRRELSLGIFHNLIRPSSASTILQMLPGGRDI